MVYLKTKMLVDGLLNFLARRGYSILKLPDIMNRVIIW